MEVAMKGQFAPQFDYAPDRGLLVRKFDKRAILTVALLAERRRIGTSLRSSRNLARVRDREIILLLQLLLLLLGCTP